MKHLFACFCLYLAVVTARDVFISPGSNNGDGTITHPFASIEDAMNSLGSNDNDVQFILFPGTYEGEENMNLSVDSLQLNVINYNLWEGSLDSTGVIFDCNLVNSTHGDVFLLSGDGSISLTGLEFNYCNSVISYSSSDHSVSNNFPISVNQCKFNGNEGDSIVVESIDTLTISNSRVDSCTGFFVRIVGANDNESVFNMNNVSIAASGGIYAYNTLVNIYDSSFTNMKDRALFLNPIPTSTNVIERCSFISPEIPVTQGNSIYLQGTDNRYFSLVGVAYCSFYLNSAVQGGAIYAGNMQIDIVNSTFEQCNANQGGSLSLSASVATIEYSTFIDSIATSGGAIYLEQESTLDLQNSIFIDNSADVGDNIYCAVGDTVTIYSQNEGFENTIYGCNIELDSSYDVSEPSQLSTQQSTNLSTQISTQFFSQLSTQESSGNVTSDVSPNSSTGGNTTLGIILVVVQGILFVIAILAAAFVIFMYRRRKSIQNVEMISDEDIIYELDDDEEMKLD